MKTAIEISKITNQRHGHVRNAVRRICKRKGIDPVSLETTYQDDKGITRLTYLVSDEVAQQIIDTHALYKRIKG